MNTPHRHTLTVLPFLMAVFIGVASMATNVVAVNRSEMGHEHTQPWRASASNGISRVMHAAQSSIATAVAGVLRSPLIASEAGQLAAELATFGVAGALNLKALRQRAVDIDKEILELESAAVDLDKQATTLRQKVRAEKREMTETEQKEYDSIAAQKKQGHQFMASLLDDKKTNAEMLAIAEERNANEKRPDLTAGSDPDADAARRAEGRVVPGKDNTAEDPKRGFKSHREFMAKVMDFGRYGRMDARLKPLRMEATAGSDEQGTYSDPHGGFLVPSGFSPDILAVAAEADPTAALTRKLPMDAPMVKINARVDKNHSTSVSGGLRVYRHSETTDAEASRMAFEQLTFQAEDLIGLAHATENQISDSPGSFVAMIADGFRDEFGAKLLQEKINGVKASGQYMGVLVSPAKIEVAKENGQKAATILVENIDKMAARCWRYTSERTVYLANPTTRPQLRGLVRNVGTGGSTVNYFTNEGGDERLDGRRIFFTEFANTVGTAGDLILVNLSEYIEGLFQALQQAESIHVRFAANERTFKFWVRNCGMPWWSSALTPKNGDTLSPIITLATRS